MQGGGLLNHRTSKKISEPKLTIVSRMFGASGQPWIWRQVNGLRDFQKELICWERHNEDSQPTRDCQEYVIPGDPAPYDGAGRWIYRCRSGWGGNFYASIGNEARQMADLIRSDPPDVMLCYFGDIAMRMLPLAQRADIPIVAYLHGDFSFLRNRWYRWSLLRCLDKFSAYIVVTSSERSWLLSKGVSSEKIHIVPCGAPTDIFLPSPKRTAGSVKFLMASRLSEDKGCDVSIRAFSQVLSSHPSSTLSVFGDGPERGNLEQLAVELKLEDRITFHGYVGEHKLARTMPLYDIFIQHSRVKEGSPVAIAEAMACGLPVVSTAIGGIVDQVVPEQTGFLVPEGDLNGMVGAMERLAADPMLRERFGIAARERAVSCYDSAQQTDRIGRILMSVIEQRSVSSAL